MADRTFCPEEKQEPQAFQCCVYIYMSDQENTIHMLVVQERLNIRELFLETFYGKEVEFFSKGLLKRLSICNTMLCTKYLIF